MARDHDIAPGEECSDYRRICAALGYLGENWSAQPSLGEIARAAGLSPSHFQRVFTRWTGTSPKRLVAALTHASARQLLTDGASVLDAALETGLSGPSRLHDVFIAEEAVTPGDVKRGGEGLVLSAGFAPSPFGQAVVLAAPRGLCGLAFADDSEEEAALADLAALGTVCDVVALTGVNRALVATGLKVMSAWRNPGLAALAEVAGVSGQGGDKRQAQREQEGGHGGDILKACAPCRKSTA